MELSSSSVGWKQTAELLQGATSPPRPLSPPPLVRHSLQDRSHWPTNFCPRPRPSPIHIPASLKTHSCGGGAAAAPSLPSSLPPSSLLQERQEKCTSRSCPPVHAALQSLVHRECTMGGFSLSFSPSLSLCRFLPDAAAPSLSER